MDPEPLPIRGDVILLQQLVKHLNLIGSGGEVKTFLATAGITVNGERETRRGRKLVDGDVVTLPGCTAVRIVAEQQRGHAPPCRHPRPPEAQRPHR